MTHHDHQLDECLELLYHLRERHQLDLKSLRDHDPQLGHEILLELQERDLITLEDDRIHLSEAGFRQAEQIIRRHRLAERLLTDVLHMSPAEVESGACEFEHVLAEEITESICTLLGHPRTCPHGSPIPQGACCLAAAKECSSAVVSLVEAPVGRWVRVAYVSSISDERQHRLTHFGILPGNMIKLHQLKPSIVVMLENSRVAMEESIARDIFVWKSWNDEPKPVARRAGGMRFWQR